MDLVEGDLEPSLEHAARLLDVSPDLLIADHRWNIEGAAALMAYEAGIAHGGELPPTGDLLAWWDALRAFSRSEDPTLQDLYARTILEAAARGVSAETAWGPHLSRPADVDLSGLSLLPPPGSVGDYPGTDRFVAAASCNYSNYSRSGSAITYVVIHVMQGSYSGSISWFQNCAAESSAHYMLRSSDGEVTQMVWEEDVAWHAGNWSYNLASVGIEHEGYIDAPSTWFTDAMYRSSADLVSSIVARTAVTADRSHILGHIEVPGATHTDPGPYWDWDYYMSLITGGSPVSGYFVGVIRDTDIYSGPSIVGASVWIEGVASATTNDTGTYYLYDLPYGTYTVHASAPGFLENTRSCNLSASEYWCSIALTPGEDEPPDDTGDDPNPDTEAPDTGSGTDTGDGPGEPGEPDPTPHPRPPGNEVALTETTGCGCASSSPALPAASLLGLALLLRRRRDP
jgi:uncharacterized protein (TIGR03382 family)